MYSTVISLGSGEKEERIYKILRILPKLNSLIFIIFLSFFFFYYYEIPLSFVVCPVPLLRRPLVSRYLLWINKNTFLHGVTQLHLFYALWEG